MQNFIIITFVYIQQKNGTFSNIIETNVKNNVNKNLKIFIIMEFIQKKKKNNICETMKMIMLWNFQIMLYNSVKN